MIQKRKARRQRKQEEPLEVELTLRYRFGESESEQVTIMDQRRLPMVGSVFKYRDKILRGFTSSLIKAGLTQKKVVSELMPLLSGWRRERSGKKGGDQR